MKQIKLREFAREDLLLAAVKSEVASRDIYHNLASKVRNAFLKDKMLFLAGEEEKHRVMLENMFREMFPEKPLFLPEKVTVPLPEIHFSTELVPLSEIIVAAIDAEEAASRYYSQLARLLGDERKEQLLRYFSSMEKGHKHLLEIERDNLLSQEEYGVEQEMIHVGP